jgi:hypothetical protein
MVTFRALGHMSLPSSCTEKHSSSSSRDMFNGDVTKRRSNFSMGGRNNLCWSVDLKAHVHICVDKHHIAKYRNACTIVFLFQSFKAP